MNKFYLFCLAFKTTRLKTLPFFSQMMIWLVSNNILEDQNTFVYKKLMV